MDRRVIKRVNANETKFLHLNMHLKLFLLIQTEFFFRNDDIEDSPTNNLLGLIIDQNLI